MSGQFNDKHMNNLKQNLKLDLNQAKKNIMTMPLLSSPDLNLLKVDTPELEKIILSNGIGTQTPTPSATAPILFPKTVTQEQESFATGFVNALNNLHNNNSNSNHELIIASENSSSTVFTDMESNVYMPAIKEEPQIVPNGGGSPPLSPVDMEYQERMKLERKRQRNRLAASKCRSRKLERISKLEEKVKCLKTENTDLSALLVQLKEHVGLLKLEVMNHHNAGCDIIGSA